MTRNRTAHIDIERPINRLRDDAIHKLDLLIDNLVTPEERASRIRERDPFYALGKSLNELATTATRNYGAFTDGLTATRPTTRKEQALATLAKIADTDAINAASHYYAAGGTPWQLRLMADLHNDPQRSPKENDNA